MIRTPPARLATGTMRTRRPLTPEHMDDPDVDAAALEASFRFIRLVNRHLGGASPILRELKRLRPVWPRDRPLRLLDLGTGAADLPLAAIAWAKARGLALECVGIDCHPGVLAIARRAAAAEARIGIEDLDARRIVEHYGVDSFDLVHAGMFLHHLPDLEVMTVLAAMSKVARLTMVWNDLVRSRFNAAAIRVLTLGQPAVVRHDAALSVAKGFSIGEVRSMARRLDLPQVRVRRVFAGRFALTSTRPGAILAAVPPQLGR